METQWVGKIVDEMATADVTSHGPTALLWHSVYG